MAVSISSPLSIQFSPYCYNYVTHLGIIVMLIWQVGQGIIQFGSSVQEFASYAHTSFWIPHCFLQLMARNVVVSDEHHNFRVCQGTCSSLQEPHMSILHIAYYILQAPQNPVTLNAPHPIPITFACVQYSYQHPAFIHPHSMFFHL